MKFSSLATTTTIALLPAAVFAAESCTNGRLFVSDADSTTVYAFDPKEGHDLDETTYTVTVPGKAGINLAATGTKEAVAAMFRGTDTLYYEDAQVSFIHAGVEVHEHDGHLDLEKEDPSLIDNASFQCARPIHYVTHDSKVAIFCDGFFIDPAGIIVGPQVNSTVWVLDETKFGDADDDSAIVFTTTLEGSHHGVAIPVDDDHVLYSLAVDERIAGVNTSTSLPATFQVVDFDNDILHLIADETNKDMSCPGLHGSSAIDNTFALACDDNHGGIVIVDYEASSSVYESRALLYPESFPDHRTGSFQEHPEADFLIGSFAQRGQQYHLMAFQETDTELTEDQILTLPEAQCSYAFEQAHGELVLVLTPTDGTFHVFEYHDNAWEQVSKKELFPGMTSCDDIFMVPGYNQAFIFHKVDKTVMTLDLHDDGEEIEVSETQLDFVPFSAVVSGVPKDAEVCGGDDHDHSSHDHSSHDDHDHSAAFSGISLSIGAFVAASLSALALIF